MLAGEQRDGAVGVVVLGMGRSGTSAVTAMFVRAGFFAGRDDGVLPANDYNASGYHENLGIYTANERVLGRLGATWFDPPPLAAQLAAREWARPELAAALGRMFRQADARPLAVKDPRIGVLLPLWEPLIEQLHPILVIRDPIEVAHSLCDRDGTPPQFALAAWELHVNLVLGYLHGRQVTVAPYARLLGDQDLAVSVVTAAAAHVDHARRRRVRAEGAVRALESELRHQRAAALEHRELLTARQQGLWRFLDSLPGGHQQLEVPASLRGVTANARAAVMAETSRLAGEQERARLTCDLVAERSLASALSREVERLSAEVERLAGNVSSRRWRVMGPPAHALASLRGRVRHP